MLLATLFDTVVMVADERSLVETTWRLQPCLVLVDLGLARRDVAGLVERLRSRVPRLKVIVITVHDEPTVVRSVQRAGADGLLVKQTLGADLRHAVETVLSGKSYFCQRDRERRIN